MFETPLIIAHRGASALCAEDNSIRAFDLALELGAHAIEMDIRRTKDKKMICFHDPEIEGRPIREFSYDEIQSRVSWTVPTLETVVERYGGKILLDVELKESGYERQIVKALSGLDPQDYMVKSFGDIIIVRIKEYNPEITTGLLLGLPKSPHPLYRYKEFFPESRLRRTQADFISPHYRLLQARFIKRMNDLEIPILVWTVNSLSLGQKLLSKGVSGIITDYPEWFLEH